MEPSTLSPARPGRSLLPARLRIGAVYLFLGALLLLSRPTPLSVGAGLAFLVAGEAIRIWAAGHLVKSVELITSGPYARVQHPLYLGRLLILTGLGVTAWVENGWNLWLLAAGYAVFFLYYFPRKLRVEGGRLRERHGERWESYAGRVPLLLPGLRPFPGSDRRWSLRQALGNQEHLFLSGLLLWVVLAVIKVRLGGP